MKKILFLFTLLIFFTGCSVGSVNNMDIDSVIKEALTRDVSLKNVVFQGYKYYLPRGVKIVDRKDNNSILLSGGSYYYLYVDITSYYHKENISYEKNVNAFLFKEFLYNGKKGYVEIDKKDNGNYYLKIMYNYAKIEVDNIRDNINDVIYDSIVILSSISYNDTILDTLIGENVLNYQEEEYDFFGSKREDGTFLDYIEEYDVYDEEKEGKDEDFIE